jgi:cytochrome c oxidase subunit 2
MKKYIIPILVMVTVLLYGCAQPTPSIEAETPEVIAPIEEELAEEVEETAEEPEQLPEPTVQEISVTAKQWEFIPDPIEVNKGDIVRLKLKSVDVAHGFSLRAFGINEQLEPNEEVVVEFVADKSGEFEFYCNVYCGSGHSGMRGKFIVNE